MPNYKAIIKQFTWFVDIQNRVWVVVGVRSAWNDELEKWNDPYMVSLLQVKTESPIDSPWSEVVELIEKVN